MPLTTNSRLRTSAPTMLVIVALVGLSLGLLWSDGLRGWLAVLVVGGGVTLLAATSSTGRARPTLWMIGGFLMGGALLAFVFRGDFDWRHGADIALMLTLLALQVRESAGPRRRVPPGI